MEISRLQSSLLVMASSERGIGETREYEIQSSGENDVEFNIEDTSKCTEDDCEDISMGPDKGDVNEADNNERPRLRRSIFPRVTLTCAQLVVITAQVPPYHVFLAPWEHYTDPPCPGLRSLTVTSCH